MLKKLDELLKQYELSDNYYEKARILREIQYLNMVVRKSIKSFIDNLSKEELIRIARNHGIDGDPDTIKTVLYTRLNCRSDIFVDLYSVNRRIQITKDITRLAEKHSVEITNDHEFIAILSNLINTINSYDLRLIPEYAEYETLDYITHTIYMSDIYHEDPVYPTVSTQAKRKLNDKAYEAGVRSNKALVKFFNNKLSKFDLDLLVLLLTNNALKPDFSKAKGFLVYRVKDFNFNDSFLTAMNEVPITMDDINYGLSLASTTKNGALKQ